MPGQGHTCWAAASRGADPCLGRDGVGPGLAAAQGRSLVQPRLSRTWADHHLDYLGEHRRPGRHDVAQRHRGPGLRRHGPSRGAGEHPFVVSKYVGTRPHPARPGQPSSTRIVELHVPGLPGRGALPSHDGLPRGDARRSRSSSPATGTSPVATARLAGTWSKASSDRRGAAARPPPAGRVPAGTLRVRGAGEAPRHLAQPEQRRLRPGLLRHGLAHVSVLGAWTKTHGGWRAIVDFPPATSPNFWYHDQLTKTEYFRLGGGASYSLTGSIDVGLNGYATVWGRSDVNMSGISLSFTYGFSPAQVIKRNRASGDPTRPRRSWSSRRSPGSVPAPRRRPSDPSTSVGRSRTLRRRSIQGEAFSLETAIQGHKAVVVLFHRRSAPTPTASLLTSASWPRLRAAGRPLRRRQQQQLGIAQEIVDARARARVQLSDDQGRRPRDRRPPGGRSHAGGVPRDRQGGCAKGMGEIEAGVARPQHALDAVLEGRPVRRPVTKAFGCAVDRH